MLRTTAEAMANEILVALADDAQLLDIDAHGAGDPSLARLLEAIGEKRTEQAFLLERQLRQLGTLPDAPDADRETAARWLEQLKETRRDDRARVKEREQSEEKLQQRINEALRAALSTPLHAMLSRMGEEIADDRRRLGQWLNS